VKSVITIFVLLMPVSSIGRPVWLSLGYPVVERPTG